MPRCEGSAAECEAMITLPDGPEASNSKSEPFSLLFSKFRMQTSNCVIFVKQETNFYFSQMKLVTLLSVVTKEEA